MPTIHPIQSRRSSGLLRVSWPMKVYRGFIASAIPAVYQVNGKEYIVFCAAERATTYTHDVPGHPASQSPIPGAYVAFALP